jgi:hypothetical protein
VTQDDAILLLEYVSAACPAQRIGEYTPDVWGELLAPYDLDDARRAVMAVASRQPFISPAEIITEIRERRAERIELAHVVYDGNPLETGAESAAARRELLRAAGDGHLPPRTVTAALGRADVPALPPGTADPAPSRVAAVLAGVGQSVPRVRDGVINPRAIACRICQALPGTSCTTRGRRRIDVHPARLDDARRIAAGLPPADPEEDRQEQERIRTAAAEHLAHTNTEETA